MSGCGPASVDGDRPTIVGGGAEERLAQLGAARADEPGQTENLSGVDGKAHVLVDRVTSQPFDPQYLRLTGSDGFWKVVAHSRPTILPTRKSRSIRSSTSYVPTS